MFAYALVTPVCGSCGMLLLNVTQKKTIVASQGVVQVICRHRECPDYDKPMEFDIPVIELRPTRDKDILKEIGPTLVVSNG